MGPVLIAVLIGVGAAVLVGILVAGTVLTVVLVLVVHCLSSIFCPAAVPLLYYALFFRIYPSA